MCLFFLNKMRGKGARNERATHSRRVNSFILAGGAWEDLSHVQGRRKEQSRK